MDFIPVYKPDLSGNEMEYVTDCIRSGWISSLGGYVTRFEEDFAALCGVKHAISLANGTVAIHLALAALRIGPGDEVIVPPLTFVATANAVRYTGAEPVFADVDPATWTLDPELVRGKITPRTRAIIAVHLYGHPADMDPLGEIAREQGLALLEDAAEAHGARYKGKMTGGLADLGCFSFYGNKAITTGEGGMLTTNDDALAERARFLKDHGMEKDRHYWHTEVGFNYRMTNLQAAVGVAQLERFDEFYLRKRELARLYREGLEDAAHLGLQPEAAWAESSFWMNSIILEDGFPLDRSSFQRALYEKGIDSRPFFYPLHLLPPYQGQEGEHPVSEYLARQGINLPSYPGLRDDEVLRICDEIRGLAV